MLDFNAETRINLADLLRIYFNIESYADTLPEAIDIVKKSLKKIFFFLLILII